MKMIPGKTLFILVLLLLKSSELTGQEDEDYDLDEDEYIEEDIPETKFPDHKDWMKTLDNNKLISDLTIPGTHDALALYGGPMAQCQVCSLDKQLKAGIRYFDLRVSGHELQIMHGVVYQRASLKDVLNTINTFLKDSNEFVLVRIKPVFPDKRRVQTLVEDLLNTYQNIYKNPKIPSIGEVRGKIVLVQKNKFKLGIVLTETDKKGDYKVTDIAEKKKKIIQHLKEANNNCKKSHALSLVYSSGTSLGTYMGFCILPKTLAEKINPWLKTHLDEEYKKNLKPCFGIIAMDFPTADLIEIIIKINT